MKGLKYPVKPLFRSEPDVDVTIHSDEESDIEEVYHNKYAGRHVRENLKEVHFLIPKAKSNLREYVEYFIARNGKKK